MDAGGALQWLLQAASGERTEKAVHPHKTETGVQAAHALECTLGCTGRVRSSFKAGYDRLEGTQESWLRAAAYGRLSESDQEDTVQQISAQQSLLRTRLQHRRIRPTCKP